MVYNDSWKYLDTSKVKHMFYTTSKDIPICGLTLWFSTEEWKSDREGLATRRKCKNCVKLGE